MQEARAVNRIGHPNIVDVFGFGTTEDQRAFLAMALLTGESLGRRLERSPSLTSHEAARILLEVSYALEAAHAAGIVHRDLKPDNVFLVASRKACEVRLLDFGIAKLTNGGAMLDGPVTSTQPGMIVGTPQYMAPEQARGQVLNGSTDIYALGVMAFEMFAGRPPFVSEDPVELVAKHITLIPPAPSDFNADLPEIVDQLLAGMLRKDPATRPTIDVVQTLLEQIRLAPVSDHALDRNHKRQLETEVLAGLGIAPGATAAPAVVADSRRARGDRGRGKVDDRRRGRPRCFLSRRSAVDPGTEAGRHADHRHTHHTGHDTTGCRPRATIERPDQAGGAPTRPQAEGADQSRCQARRQARPEVCETSRRRRRAAKSLRRPTHETMKWLLVIVVMAWGPLAAAQPAAPADPAPDKTLYDQGTKHYDLAEYAAAIESFRASYDLVPQPLLLFDIAQAYRQLHDCEHARTFYKSYLRNLPTADNRDKVEHFIAEMDACVVATPQPIQAHPVAPAAPIVMPPRHRALLVGGVVTSILGLAAAGTAVYFSNDAANQARYVESLCQFGCEGADIAAVDQRGRDSARNAIVLYGIGGTLFATGVGMVLWAALRTDEPVMIAPVPGGATISTVVRF